MENCPRIRNVESELKGWTTLSSPTPVCRWETGARQEKFIFIAPCSHSGTHEIHWHIWSFLPQLLTWQGDAMVAKGTIRQGSQAILGLRKVILDFWALSHSFSITVCSRRSTKHKNWGFVPGNAFLGKAQGFCFICVLVSSGYTWLEPNVCGKIKHDISSEDGCALCIQYSELIITFQTKPI